MNYNTQNAKIAGISEKTLVVGIDVGSETHYARAFDWRGIEFSKKAFAFSNNEEGFTNFMEWMKDFMERYGKDVVIPGMEPTGHYWFNLGRFLQDNGIKPVHVNPHHVKKSKELDDNNPTKNDRKDPKVIAGLVNEGRYSYPYIPEGVYAEIRTLSNLSFQTENELTRIKNRIVRWISIYFPEYKDVYGKMDSKSGLLAMRHAPLLSDLIALGAEGINKIWRDVKMRAAGLKREKNLVEAAKHSVGCREGLVTARIEIINLISDYEMYSERKQMLNDAMDELMKEVPYIDKLLEIKGVGVKTVTGFIAEVGNIRRFDDPKQLQKLAGYALVKNSSGKHKGKTRISKRGRKRLRYILFEVAMSLVSRNAEFKSLHNYYTTREKNPLKKMQSLIAIACKAIRVFYAILKDGRDYDGNRMMSDIRRIPQVHVA